jgi:transcriptional regulator GlxA family with amidase domain
MTPLRSRNASAATNSLRAISNSAAHANGTNGSHITPERNGAATPPRLSIVAPQENRVRKILRLIESEPAHSIHDLAEIFNLSHSHLQHLFKQQTGVQLGHLLMEQRLLKAAHLLERSTMSVKEIGYAVGYEHASSFIRAFERRFGLAPRSYRRQNDRTS